MRQATLIVFFSANSIALQDPYFSQHTAYRSLNPYEHLQDIKGNPYIPRNVSHLFGRVAKPLSLPYTQVFSREVNPHP